MTAVARLGRGAAPAALLVVSLAACGAAGSADDTTSTGSANPATSSAATATTSTATTSTTSATSTAGGSAGAGSGAGGLTAVGPITRYAALPHLGPGWVKATANETPDPTFTVGVWRYFTPGFSGNACELRVSAEGGQRKPMEVIAQLDEAEMSLHPDAKTLRRDITASTDPRGTVLHYDTTGRLPHGETTHTWRWRLETTGSTLVSVIASSVDAHEGACHAHALADAVRWTGTEHPTS